MKQIRNPSRVGIAIAAALLSLALATPSWAGQVNLLARTTQISETITTSIGLASIFQTISGTGSIDIVSSVPIATTVTRQVTISETFSSTSATVSFELAQDGINYTSPYENIFSGSIRQIFFNPSSGVAGIVSAQLTVGAGNVSVASKSVLDGIALGSIYASTSGSGTVGATSALTLALVPGFALQNSNVNALVLAATNAVANSAFQLPGGAVTAIDVEQVDLNEYSPHGNLAATAGVSQTVAVFSNAGLSTVQIQAGAGNVQTTHNVVLVNSSLVTGSIVINPGT